MIALPPQEDERIPLQIAADIFAFLRAERDALIDQSKRFENGTSLQILTLIDMTNAGLTAMQGYLEEVVKAQ